MALSREQVGLIFKLDAETKEAKAELAAFKDFVDGVAEGVRAEIEASGHQIEAHYRKRAETAEGAGKRIAKSNSVVKESVESVSSEIIESFGVDGDVANMLANQMVNLRSAAALASIGVVGAVAAIGAGFVAAANRAAELGDKINDLRQQTGLTAETLSGLGAAARLEGKSLGDLSGALTGFTGKLADAQKGNKELQATFQVLGVNLKGDTDQALRQVVIRLSEMKDGAQKTALAQKVFGDSGAELIPVLNSVEGGIDGAIAKAKELGLFFDNEGAASAARYEDQINELSAQFDGLVVRIGNAVIPTFTAYLKVLNETAGAVGRLLSEQDSFGEFLSTITSLGLIAQNPVLMGALASTMGSGKDKPKTPPPKLPPTGARAGTRTDKESAEALRRLQIQLREEEQAQKSAQENIRRIYGQRQLDEFEFTNRQIAAAQDRLEKEKAILDQERQVVEGSKFSADKKKTELERIATARKDIERQTADDIEKINDDLRKRLEQIGVALEQAKAKAEEESLQRRAQAIRFAREQEAISNEEAERQLTEITQRQIENRLALANAEVDRAGENAQLKAVAIEKVKALEIELAAAVEEAARRMQAARERDLQDRINKANEIKRIQQEIDAAMRQSEQGQFGARSIFGDAFADTLRRTGSEMQAFGAMFAEWQAGLRAELEQMPSLAEAAFGAFTQGLTEMAVAFALTGQTGPAAMRQLAAGVLQALAKLAATKAIYELAEGFAALARGIFGDPRGFAEAGHHFTAAAIYGAVAAVAGLAGRAVAPSSGAAAGGGTGGGGGNARGDRTIIEQGNRQPEPLVIVIRAETEPGVMVRKVVEDYRNNGPSRQALRRDLLGEGQ